MCNRGCDATGIAIIIRLDIVAAMQLPLSCMQCRVVLAMATVLCLTSYTWCLHSNQRYIPFLNQSLERNRSKTQNLVCVTLERACIAPESNVGATLHQTSPLSREERGRK
jgi:hypothetical protein